LTTFQTKRAGSTVVYGGVFLLSSYIVGCELDRAHRVAPAVEVKAHIGADRASGGSTLLPVLSLSKDGTASGLTLKPVSVHCLPLLGGGVGTMNREPRTTNRIKNVGPIPLWRDDPWLVKMRESRDDFRTFFISACQTSVQFEEIQELVAQVQM
jgi:hypothetical protein